MSSAVLDNREKFRYLVALVLTGGWNQKTYLTIPPADLTVDANGSTLKMRVILQNINFRKETGKDVDEINGDALILVGEKWLHIRQYAAQRCRYKR